MSKKNILRVNAGILLCLCLLLTGCAVGPDYPGTPRMGIAKQYETPDVALIPSGEIIKEWWKVFNDPILDYLISEAEAGNLNLATAAARVYEAKYQVTYAVGGYLPGMGSQASVTGQENYSSLTTPRNAHEVYTLGFDASWEIDLFGRVARTVEAAEANLAYAKEDFNDVLISLYAEVARTYINLRTVQLQLVTSEDNIKSQREMLQLTRTLFNYGLATDLDVAQAERVLATSETQLPLLRMSINQNINALGILLGKEPTALHLLLSERRSIPTPAATINVGVPTNLIRQRPDIRRAERSLAAAVANIGIAEGELYPTLTFEGAINFSALQLSSLVTPATRAFSFGPSLRWNLFSGGKIRANIKTQDARALQAIYQYENTVLNALNEMENAMNSFMEYKIQYQSQAQVVASAKREQDLAVSLYRQGLVSFQNVLDAQLAVFSAENQMAASEGQAALNCVAIYKALGGGWDPYNPPAIPNMDPLLLEVERTGTLNNDLRIGKQAQ